MDTYADSDSFAQRLRAIEPVLFFVGVLLAVVATIALVAYEAHFAAIGPTDHGSRAGHAH